MRVTVRPLSIRAKVLASGMLGVLAITLFTSLYFPYRQRQTALTSMRERSGTLAGTLAVAVGIGIELHDFDAVSVALDWVKQDSALRYVVVVDTAGNVFASYNPRQVKIDINAARDKPGLTETEDAIRAAVPIRFRERDEGTLFLEMSLRPVHAQISRDRRAALIVSLLSIGLGIALSWYLSRRIAAPLVALRQATDKVSGGDYRITELPAGDDELGALASAFNLMTKKIAESIAQLEHQASELLEGRDQAIENATKYRLLFDSNPEPMWVYDVASLRFLTVNEAAIRHYGYTRDEFLSMTIKEIRPEAESARLDEMLRTRSGSAISRNDMRHQKKDGTMIEVEVSADSIGLDGRAARLVLSYDVTGRKRLEEQLRQAQKMEAVGQLAGGVAHDFNNILTVVLSVSELLIDEPGVSAEMIEALEEIRNAGQRAAGLTRQLLAFSRKQVLAPQILALNGVVQGMEKMLQRLLGEDIALRTVLADDLGQVRADPGQLEQVIMNLAVNARDAMPTGGVLTMETANVELNSSDVDEQHAIQPGYYVMLAITDSGTGMSAETRARIFEPFFTTKDPGVGTGLGLATVYGIVKQSAGHVSVYSEPDTGTTFKIYLPRIDQPVDVIDLRPSVGTLGGTETVLVVEDDESVRRVTTRILRGQGYTVLESSSGPEALEIARKLDRPIQLLVTDVVMPGMSGRELSERLRLVIPDVKVLFVSGYTDDVILQHGILEPGTEFLKKPFTVEGLARKLRTVLDG